MEWNQEIFYNNIKLLIKERCAGNATIFNEKIHSRDAATRWKTKKPTLKMLDTIVDVFDVSMNWLRTGQGEMMSRPGPAVHFIREFQAEYTHNNVIADVGAILASGDVEIISALSSYVRESKRALAERKKLNACEVELEKNRQEMADLRRTVDRLSSTHAGAGQRAASSGSGKT